MHETRPEETRMDARLTDALAGCNGCDLEDADPADPRGYGPACQAESDRETAAYLAAVREYEDEHPMAGPF